MGQCSQGGHIRGCLGAPMSRADNANSGESAATVTHATGASGATALSPRRTHTVWVSASCLRRKTFAR